MGYKVGDEVLVRGVITDLHEGTDHPYFVAVNYDSVHWVSEDKIIPMDKTYTKGLADAWELAKKIVVDVADGGFPCDVLDKIFGSHYASNVLVTYTVAEEALAKIEAYEEEKEIKVGSIVRVKDEKGEAIVTAICPTGVAYVMWKDGSSGDYEFSELETTGRTAEGLGDLLRQIKE